MQVKHFEQVHSHEENERSHELPHTRQKLRAILAKKMKELRRGMERQEGRVFSVLSDAA